MSRFIYKDQTGPLLDMHSKFLHASKKSFECLEPIIDVYIVLHNGTIAKAWIGQLSNPPYINANTTTSMIEDWYKKERGANNVYIKIVDDKHMDQVENDVWHEVTTRHLINLTGFILENYERRFRPYSRMFYLRHLVYSMTLQRQQEYNSYVSLREDNYFFSPLCAADLMLDQAIPSSSSQGEDEKETFKRQLKPWIMVEKWCKWGAYSDKLHIGSSLGIATLYGRTWWDYVQLMVRWTQYAHIPKAGDPFSTEVFLNELMATATVEERDFKRIDMRYVSGKLCTPGLYVKCLQKGMKMNNKTHEFEALELHTCGA